MRWIRGMFDDDVEPLERWSVETEEPEGAVPETWNVKQYVSNASTF